MAEDDLCRQSWELVLQLGHAVDELKEREAEKEEVETVGHVRVQALVLAQTEVLLRRI